MDKDRTSDQMGFLNAEQLVAIELLAYGATDEDAARAAGVHRVTVWRWRHLPRFVAALNRRTQFLIEELSRDRRALYGEALSAVRKGIGDGNTSLAMAYLKLVDVDSISTVGPVTEGGVLAAEGFRSSSEAHQYAILSPEQRMYVQSDLVAQGEETPGGVNLNNLSDTPDWDPEDLPDDDGESAGSRQND